MSEELDDKRAFGMRLEMCKFYFDLDNASYLPKLTKYVTVAGAVHCGFSLPFYLIILHIYTLAMLGILGQKRDPLGHRQGSHNGRELWPVEKVGLFHSALGRYFLFIFVSLSLCSNPLKSLRRSC